VEAVIPILFWLLWVLALTRSRLWATFFASRYAHRGTRAHRFWVDWGFLILAPFIAVGGRWPPARPRLALVSALAAAVTFWRLRSEGTWRLCEPPLRK
jgi:hypothetical protein